MLPGAAASDRSLLLHHTQDAPPDARHRRPHQIRPAHPGEADTAQQGHALCSNCILHVLIIKLHGSCLGVPAQIDIAVASSCLF